MALTYATIRETVVQGVVRASMPNPLPLDRIRMQFDAGFFTINSTVSEAFAADESRRELLRGIDTVTFAGGDAAIPTSTLKKFIEDCTLVVSGVQYSYRRYPQWLSGSSRQLGLWTQAGETLKAKTKVPVVAVNGAATFSSIKSPDVPTTENDDFVAPEDFVPDLINAMTQYILAEIAEKAAQTA